MPFTVDDVEKYNKGLAAAQKRQWVAVANSVLDKCIADGGTDETCAPKAITQANGVVKESEPMADKMQEQAMKTVGGERFPASDFLVVEDPEKPSTWHLQVKVHGTPDHNMMGGAWAALTDPQGHRGNKYEGPKKADAIRKLRAMYKSEDMPIPGSSESAAIGENGEEVEGPSIMARSPGPVTFADLNSQLEAQEKASEIHWLTSQFSHLVNNIFAQLEPGQYVGALQSLMGEFTALFNQKLSGDTGAMESDPPIAIHEDGSCNLSESASGVALALAEAEPAPVNAARAPLLVDFRIIKPGPGNRRDRHYYPAEMLREYGNVFAGVDVYVTDHNEQERGERTKVGKVQEIVGWNDGPVGRVAIYDPALAEKTRNRAAVNELSTLECSIRAGGRARKGTVDGKEYNVVEAITDAVAVDLVSKAGAGGQALALAETAAEPQQTGGDNVTDNELHTEPTTSESVQEAEPVTIAEQQEAAEAEPAPVLLDEKAVKDLLDKSGLPGASIKRLAESQYTDETALTSAITAEKAYIAELTEAGQPFGLGQTQAPAQGMTAEQYEAKMAEIEKRHGIMRA